MSVYLPTVVPGPGVRSDRPFWVFPQAVIGSTANPGPRTTDEHRWSNVLRGFPIVPPILMGLGLLLVGLVPALFAALILLMVGLTPLLVVGFGIWLTEGVGVPDEKQGEGAQFQI
jgi:hypothetical protein